MFWTKNQPNYKKYQTFPFYWWVTRNIQKGFYLKDFTHMSLVFYQIVFLYILVLNCLNILFMYLHFFLRENKRAARHQCGLYITVKVCLEFFPTHSLSAFQFCMFICLFLSFIQICVATWRHDYQCIIRPLYIIKFHPPSY